MIKANAHKYSVSAMCRVLQVNRSTYYYEAAAKKMNQNSLQTFRKFLEKAGTIMVHERSRKNWLIAGNRYQDEDWTDYETGRSGIKAILQHSLNRKKTDVMNQK